MSNFQELNEEQLENVTGGVLGLGSVAGGLLGTVTGTVNNTLGTVVGAIPSVQVGAVVESETVLGNLGTEATASIN